MNITKHTPGPWYEARTGSHQGLVVDEKTGANVAVVYDKADAKLIAKAPELLDQVRRALTIIEADKKLAAFYKTGWISTTRAILAELEG